VNGCTIYDFDGNQKRLFPGKFCTFLSDGHFLTVDNNGISLFNQKSERKWLVPGHFHHQLNMSEDGQRILVMGSELILMSGRQIRVDKFMVIAMDGKVLHEISATELFKQAKVEPSLWKANPDAVEYLKTDLEISHANSFYEIPLEQRSSLGRYVINIRNDGIFFLDEDFKSLKEHFKLSSSFTHQVHDVQVLKNGKILLFNNLNAINKKKHLSSSVLELDAKTKKVLLDTYPQILALSFTTALLLLC
jgi:hypothetical protein